MSMVLQCKEGGDFKPHPEGIHPGVCIDCIDLGMVRTEFQGQERIVPKVRLVFETEQKTEDGRNCTVSKTFTASLHPKSKLAEFLGKWRGRPVMPGESIDLANLIGACCTLVVSHQQSVMGKSYASIDAISKPTKKLTASGGYDGAAARQRIAEWKAKTPAPQAMGSGARRGPGQVASEAWPAAFQTGEDAIRPGSKAAQTGAEDNVSFDPEVGF